MSIPFPENQFPAGFFERSETRCFEIRVGDDTVRTFYVDPVLFRESFGVGHPNEKQKSEGIRRLEFLNVLPPHLDYDVVKYVVGVVILDRDRQKSLRESLVNTSAFLMDRAYEIWEAARHLDLDKHSWFYSEVEARLKNTNNPSFQSWYLCWRHTTTPGAPSSTRLKESLATAEEKFCNPVEQSTFARHWSHKGLVFYHHGLQPDSLFSRSTADRRAEYSATKPEEDQNFLIRVASLYEEREQNLVKAFSRFLNDLDDVLPIWHTFGFLAGENSHQRTLNLLSWLHSHEHSWLEKSKIRAICQTLVLARQANEATQEDYQLGRTGHFTRATEKEFLRELSVSGKVLDYKFRAAPAVTAREEDWYELSDKEVEKEANTVMSELEGKLLSRQKMRKFDQKRKRLDRKKEHIKEKRQRSERRLQDVGAESDSGSSLESSSGSDSS
jgi:hypothetical protein